jgi:hypothetical protein
VKLSQTVWAWRAENREKMTKKKPMVPFHRKNPSKKRCFSTPQRIPPKTFEIMKRNLPRAKGYTRSMPKVYISLPWGVGFHPSHPLKVGAIFFFEKFQFLPLKGRKESL